MCWCEQSSTRQRCPGRRRSWGGKTLLAYNSRLAAWRTQLLKSQRCLQCGERATKPHGMIHARASARLKAKLLATHAHSRSHAAAMPPAQARAHKHARTHARTRTRTHTQSMYLSLRLRQQKERRMHDDSRLLRKSTSFLAANKTHSTNYCWPIKHNRGL